MGKKEKKKHVFICILLSTVLHFTLVSKMNVGPKWAEEFTNTKVSSKVNRTKTSSKVCRQLPAMPNIEIKFTCRLAYLLEILSICTSTNSISIHLTSTSMDQEKIARNNLA